MGEEHNVSLPEDMTTCMAHAWDSYLTHLEVDQIGNEQDAGTIGRSVLSAIIYGYTLAGTNGAGLTLEQMIQLEEQVMFYAIKNPDSYPMVTRVAAKWG